MTCWMKTTPLLFSVPLAASVPSYLPDKCHFPREVMRTEKNSCKAKCPQKKFHARKNSRKKHTQDEPHFDIKPDMIIILLERCSKVHQIALERV